MDSNQSVSLSPTQRTPISSSTGNSSFVIRAPPSFDSDTETPLKIKNSDSSNTSSSSGTSGSDSEEEFASGEEEEEETLNGSLGIPSLRPKAQISGDFDDVVVGNDESGSDEAEVEDDGVSSVRVLSVGELGKMDSGVETPKVRILEDEEGEEESEVVLGLVGDLGGGGKGSEVIGDDGLVENPESGVLGDEKVRGGEGESSVGSGLIEGSGIAVKGSGVIGNDGLVENSESPVVSEVSEAALLASVASKEVSIHDDSKFDDANSANGGMVGEVADLKNEVIEEKKGEGSDSEQVDGVSFSTGANSNVGTEQPIEVEETGVSDVKEVDKSVEESKALDHESGAARVVTEEMDDSKLVDVDKDVVSNGDAPVGTNLSGLETGVVGDLDEKIHSETETPGLTVKRTASLGVGPDHAVPVDPKLVEEVIDVANVDEQSDLKDTTSEQVFEPVATSECEERELQEPKAEAEEVEQENVEKNGVDGDENGCLDPNNDIAKPESGSVSLNKLGAGQNEKGALAGTSHTPESAVPISVSVPELKEEVEANPHSDYDEENGSVLDEDEGLMSDGSETADPFMKALAQRAGEGSHMGSENSQDHSQRIDGQIVMDSDDEVDTDEEGGSSELFDSAALQALFTAARNAQSESGAVTVTSSDASRLFSLERPAGLGTSMPSLKPAPRINRGSPFTFNALDNVVGEELENNLSEEERKKLEKMQLMRVKFLRLVHRLGYSADESLVAQVLYRFVLAAGRKTGPAFSLEAAKKTALQLEEEGKDDLDFSLNILVLGKTGVGKSATINSIFGEERTAISAFKPATTAVKEIIGDVGGVKIRVFDTPGLRSSVMEHVFNRKVLLSVKKFTKKCPPDILLYVDRLDSQTRDLNDLPLLRSITNTLGSSIWRSAVVTLTHAASAPPDGPSGSPLSYEMFVAQRSHFVQQSIGQAVGDLRLMNPSMMNPVSLVENHQSCRRNREGQKILPNGQIWRPQLLLFCYSLKILAEVNSLSKPQDLFDQRKLFGFRVRSPPLPYLLSSLLQSRAHPKLPNDQGVETVDSEIDLEDLAESEQEEEEDEYDQLPPFKPLRKSQIAKLSKEQRNAYFDEYDYRVKLLQKKQWKDELRRMKELKKRGKGHIDDYGNMGEDTDQENAPAAVPVPLPDMVLPPSFDGDNPAYRYRFLEPTSQLLARPVLDNNGWDHDCGYDGVSLEENLAIAGRFPAGVAVQITKDKKEFNIHLDSSVAAKHGEDGSTLGGFDIQTVGKQLAYILRGETKFKKLKRNKMTGGVSVTFLGENVATGIKFEDHISIGKRFTLVGSTGAIRSQDDLAYGANFEACVKEKDFPVGQDQSTLGLSLMKWRGRGDLALGANLQSQFSIGRSSKMAVRVGLNNKLSGQITIRTSSSEQLQLALVGLLPIAISIYRSIWPEAGESYSAY